MEHKTWIDAMIERFKNTAEMVRQEKLKGTESVEIVKKVDHESFSAIFRLITCGVLKVKKGFFESFRDIRNDDKYKEWHKRILKRDNYTCVECKIKGGKLEVHHIRPLSKFPELAIEMENGQTLCNGCHKKTNSYGGRARYYRQEQAATG